MLTLKLTLAKSIGHIYYRLATSVGFIRNADRSAGAKRGPHQVRLSQLGQRQQLLPGHGKSSYRRWCDSVSGLLYPRAQEYSVDLYVILFSIKYLCQQWLDYGSISYGHTLK